MPVGVDTGFFYLLKDDHPVALKIWETEEVIASAVSIYELQKHILTGEFKDLPLAEKIEQGITVMPVNKNIAKKAAKISHTFGIHSLDSLILSSLVEAGCKKIYSADPHFKEFREKNIKVIQLKKSDF
jgi:predicted nucleic acid-binding protein